MAEPIRVIVRRGGVVEATHLVHAVAVQRRPQGRRGRRPGARHAASLLGQAVPGAAARAGLRGRRPARARDRLGVAPGRARRSSTPCGCCSRARTPARTTSSAAREGHPPSRLKHNCSGKHAGMLAVCRARRLAARRATGSRATAMQRRNLARRRGRGGRRRGRDPDGSRRLRRPDVRPHARADGRDVRAARGDARGRAGRGRDARPPGADPRPGRDRHGAHADASPAAVAKGGAEGLLCGTLPGRRGLRLKVRGRRLSRAPSCARVRCSAASESDSRASPSRRSTNSRGEHVGTIAAVEFSKNR